MSKKTFERTILDVDYQVEAEMLPSGAALFTFVPPLPGRTPTIQVHGATVFDVLRTLVMDMEYNSELGGVAMTLYMVPEDLVEDTEDEIGFKTVTEIVPTHIALELVLDQFQHACSDCGELEFGEDVEADGPDDDVSSKKRYLN